MRDDASYKGQRRKEAAKAADKLKKVDEDGLFFGASPTQKKELRKTEDRKTVDLRSLDMNAALDREKLGAPEEKIGENLRLIDMAMGKDKPPTEVVRKEVIQRAADAKTRRTKKQPPAKSLSGMLRLRLSKKARQQAALEAAQVPKAAPDYAGQGVVVPRPSRLDRVLLLLAFLSLGTAALLNQLGSAVELPAANTDAVLRWLTTTPQGWLAALAPVFVLLGMSVRIQRRPRGSALAELVRAVGLALLPAALGAGFLLWATGDAGAPAALAAPLGEALAPLADASGLPAWALGTLPWAVLCLVVGLLVRRRRPRLGEG